MIRQIFNSDSIYEIVVPAVQKFIATNKTTTSVHALAQQILFDLSAQPAMERNEFFIKLDGHWRYVEANVQLQGKQAEIVQLRIRHLFDSDSISKVVVPEVQRFVAKNPMRINADSVAQEILSALVSEPKRDHYRLIMELDGRKYFVEARIVEKAHRRPEIVDLKIYKEKPIDPPRSPVLEPISRPSSVPLTSDIEEERPASKAKMIRSLSGPLLEEEIEIKKRFTLYGVEFNLSDEMIEGMEGRRGEDHIVSLSLLKGALKKKLDQIRRRNIPHNGWYFQKGPTSQKALNLVLRHDPNISFITVFTAYFMSPYAIKTRFQNPRMSDIEYEAWLRGQPSL